MSETVDSELKKTRDAFEEEVRNMTAAIQSQTAALSRPAPSAPAPQADMTPDGLTKLAQEKGVGAALQAVGQHVLAPMQNEAYDLAIKTQRRVVERDADLGKWAKKHSKAIDEAIRANPGRVANEGVDTIVRDLRDRDGDYQNERVEAEVTRRIAEEKAKLAPTQAPLPVATRPPVDRPGSAPNASPSPSPSANADLASIEVNPDAFAVFQELVPGGTEDEFRAQRLAMNQAEKDLGRAGLRKAGGYPICTLEEIGQGRRP